MVTITSEPRMPRGTLRCGFFVSSAVVATTSKPMNAKNTRLAAASRPYQPKLLFPAPVSQENSDWCRPSSALPGCDGGI